MRHHFDYKQLKDEIGCPGKTAVVLKRRPVLSMIIGFLEVVGTLFDSRQKRAPSYFV